jgi:hypothetical protein
MHLAVQLTSPRVQALRHLVISDCEVWAGSTVVEVAVARVVGVVVIWAVARAARKEDRRRVV